LPHYGRDLDGSVDLKEVTMIMPGSTVDWIMGATMLSAVVAFAAAAHRWMPDEPIARSATTAPR